MRKAEGLPMTIGRVFTTITEPESKLNGKATMKAPFTVKEAEEMQLKELEQCVSAVQKHLEQQDAKLEDLAGQIKILIDRLGQTDLKVATLTQDLQAISMKTEPIGERV